MRIVSFFSHCVVKGMHCDKCFNGVQFVERIMVISHMSVMVIYLQWVTCEVLSSMRDFSTVSLLQIRTMKISFENKPSFDPKPLLQQLYYQTNLFIPYRGVASFFCLFHTLNFVEFQLEKIVMSFWMGRRKRGWNKFQMFYNFERSSRVLWRFAFPF